MNKSYARNLTAVLIVALLPVFCSCSLFQKNKVVDAANAFAESITLGDSSDILRKTDGLDREFKASFKNTLDIANYDDEECLYAAQMMKSITYEVDSSSVQIEKDTASVVITFTMADHEALMDGDYKDAQALADAVPNCAKKTITVTAELARVEKEWYITNFNSAEFQDIYAFLSKMPPIGKGTLIDTAKLVAKAVVEDEPGVAALYAVSDKDSGSPDIASYVGQLFDVNGDPTEEEIAFRDAVKNTMVYEIDESTLTIDGKNGSVVIRITMADFGTLAGKQFSKISDITEAVAACDTVTYSYTCELVRNGPDWFITNLDSPEFTAFLAYKKFSINLKNIDGTYTSTIDITDKFVAYVAKEFSISMPSDLEGRIYITTTLTLKNGQYEVTVDRDAFVANIKTFVETNIDKIIMNMLGTTSSYGLDALAKIAGYKDYADMRAQVLAQVTANLETINTAGLESSGTFTLNDNVVTLKSATDTMTGTIDNYGVITVTSPVNDPDAKKLLGSDTITMAFKKG